MLSSLTQKNCNNNEPILTSTQASGIVQDTFAGLEKAREAKRR